jgi:adenylylsulfate kinase
MIILFYGQPASGKTTLADALSERIFAKSVRIDGDKWRDITQNKDYSKEGRVKNLKGAFDMAIYLEREGFLPILSFVTPYEELRQYLNDKSQHLVEIYLEYNEDRGRNKNFAIDFEIPKMECLRINTSELSILDCVTKVMNYINEKTN